MTRRSLIAGLLLAPFARLLKPLTSWRSRFDTGGIVDGKSIAIAHYCDFTLPRKVADDIARYVKFLPIDTRFQPVNVSMEGKRLPDGSIQWTGCSLVDGSPFGQLLPVKPVALNSEPRSWPFPITGGIPWKPNGDNRRDW